MVEFIIIVIIFIIAACKRTVPLGHEAVVRRNGEIYKTYKSGESFYINPFTDTVNYIKAGGKINKNMTNASRSARAIIPDEINNKRNSSSGYTRTLTLRGNYSLRSSDNKSVSVKTYAFFKLKSSSTVSQTYLDNIIKQEVVKFYSQLTYDDISDNATGHELNLFDILRDKFSTNLMKLEKFEATPSNARITTRNTYDNKEECTHYSDDYSYKKKTRPNDPKYSYSAGNAIKNSPLDTLIEQRGNPISSDEYDQQNPIKDTLNITTMFNSGDMIDVNNMDSNVDPIDNKY